MTDLTAYTIWLKKVDDMFRAQSEVSVFDLEEDFPIETLFKVGYFPSEVWEFWVRSNSYLDFERKVKGGYEF